MKKEIKVVGKASEEIKKKEQEKIERFYFDHLRSVSGFFDPKDIEEIRSLEYFKTPKEIQSIKIADKLTSDLMKGCGVDPYNIAPENIHIVPPELYKKLGKGGTLATAISPWGAALFNAEHFRGRPLLFCDTLIHELLHLKAYLSLEVNESKVDNKDDVKKTIRRQGVSLYGSQKNSFHEHFRGLDEAIVEETTKRLFPKIFELEEFKQEKEWLSSPEAQTKKEKYAKEYNIPKEEIIWVFPIDDKDLKRKFYGGAYLSQREVLKYVCEEIQKQFSDKFKNPDDVYKLFLKAHFDGNILEIGRLVEKTFGKSSFRVLGSMNENENSAELCLEHLKKARRIMLSKTKK
jgi:hypothetical protein